MKPGSLGFLLVVLLSTTGIGQETDPEDALREKIARLEAELEILSAQLEGTAPLINLARTSLAAVTASSVNGDRPMNNPYYGVLNLFDEGTNWYQGLQYSYWLTSGEPSPWVEVHFDRPVTICALEVEQGPSFSARLRFEEGREDSLPVASGRLSLPSPRAGVRAVRLTFQGGGNRKVHELRVLGHAPDATPLELCLPRVKLTRTHVEAVARESYAAWKEELLGSPRQEVTQLENGDFEVRFYRAGQELLRVVVGESGPVALHPGIQLVPATGASPVRPSVPDGSTDKPPAHR